MINKLLFLFITILTFLLLISSVLSITLLIICTIEYTKNNSFECDQPLDKLLWTSWSLLLLSLCFLKIKFKDNQPLWSITWFYINGLIGIVLWSFGVNITFNSHKCPKDFLLFFKIYSLLMVFLSSTICSILVTNCSLLLLHSSSSTDSTSTSSSDSSSSLLA